MSDFSLVKGFALNVYGQGNGSWDSKAANEAHVKGLSGFAEVTDTAVNIKTNGANNGLGSVTHITVTDSVDMATYKTIKGLAGSVTHQGQGTGSWDMLTAVDAYAKGIVNFSQVLDSVGNVKANSSIAKIGRAHV